MKVNIENTLLFSACTNGVVAVFTLSQKGVFEPKAQVQFYDEILIEKEQRDRFKRNIQALKDDLESDMRNNEEQTRHHLQEQI